MNKRGSIKNHCRSMKTKLDGNLVWLRDLCPSWGRSLLVGAFLLCLWSVVLLFLTFWFGLSAGRLALIGLELMLLVLMIFWLLLVELHHLRRFFMLEGSTWGSWCWECLIKLVFSRIRSRFRLRGLSCWWELDWR